MWANAGEMVCVAIRVAIHYSFTVSPKVVDRYTVSDRKPLSLYMQTGTRPQMTIALANALPAAPADADPQQLSRWMFDSGTDTQFRQFVVADATAYIRTHTTGRVIEIAVRGEQFDDGRVVRYIELDGQIDGLETLDAHDARSLAAALWTAADRADQAAAVQQ